MDSLNVGMWNLKVHRNPKIVAEEVARLFVAARLDVLAVQEAWTYRPYWDYDAVTTPLRNAEEEARALLLTRYFADRGLKVVAKGDWKEADECFFITRAGIRVRGVRNRLLTNGYWANRTRRMKVGRSFIRAKFDGWLRLANVHYPAGSTLEPSGAIRPSDKEDDILVMNEWVSGFLRLPGRRGVLGDFNRGFRNRYPNSPRWLAENLGVQIVAPNDAGIDLALFKGARAADVRELGSFDHNSDHDPIVMTVSKQ